MGGEMQEHPTRLPPPPPGGPRVFENWPGNDNFYCDGRCMMGPSPQNLVGTALVVFIPSVVFNVFVVPDVANAYHVVIMAVSILWPLWCVGNLVSTGMSDPGILVRLPSAPANPDARPRPRYREERLENGKSVTVKWNDTCNFYQPPRAHHCSVNNDCIDRFDHHCPWVGTTIGRRNYRTFIGFVFGTTILCIYTTIICALQIKIKYDDIKEDEGRTVKAMGKAPAALVVMAISFVAFWFVGVLSAFHSYLIATNQTTYENFRDGYSADENPYNRGCVGNCWEVLFGRMQPSRFRFRGTAAEQPSLELAEVAVTTQAATAQSQQQATRRRAVSPPPPNRQQTSVQPQPQSPAALPPPAALSAQTTGAGELPMMMPAVPYSRSPSRSSSPSPSPSPSPSRSPSPGARRSRSPSPPSLGSRSPSPPPPPPSPPPPLSVRSVAGGAGSIMTDAALGADRDREVEVYSDLERGSGGSGYEGESEKGAGRRK